MPLSVAPLPVVPPDPASYRSIAKQEAAKAGVPFDLVDAVMKIESDYHPDSIGGVGEVGLMQVRPETAALLGFQGDSKGLADPAVNIHYGTTYLGRAWQLAGGAVCRTLMKYRAGHGEETMSPLSAAYCSRAREHLLEMGSPLAASITLVDLVPTTAPIFVVRAGPAKAGMIPKAIAVAEVPLPRGPGFWPALQARVRRIDAQIEAKWRKAGR